MSTQRVDLVVIGWKCPYSDAKKYEQMDGNQSKVDFYEDFVSDKDLDYYNIEKNDMNKGYCFFDGCGGEFIVWGIPLAAKCDDSDVMDFEIKAWSKEELTAKKMLAKQFRDTLPECIRPEGKPQLIIFTQYH